MADEVILNAGQSTAIEVPFTGNPQPEVKWTFNGGKFTDARRIKSETIFNMTSMTMAKAQRGDAGKYEVALSNPHGSSKCTITVIVLGEWIYSQIFVDDNLEFCHHRQCIFLKYFTHYDIQGLNLYALLLT